MPVLPEACQGIHAEVLGASSTPPRVKRILWRLRGHGVLWALREVLMRMRLIPRPSQAAQQDRSGSPSRLWLPLDLQPGEWVQIKSESEIRDLLDSRGKTAGLAFMPEMWKLCGRRFKVFKRLDRFISEATGELRMTKNTVLLEGVVCDGSAHLDCNRSCFLWWKEAWVRRVEP